MKLFLHTVVFLLAILFTYCSTSKEENENASINLANRQFQDKIFREDYVSDIDYRTIDVTDSTIIASVNQILVGKENLYLADYTTDKVYIIDTCWKVVKVINSKGKGPKEYIGVNRIAFNQSSEKLLLFDQSTRTTHVYNSQGNWERKIIIEPFSIGPIENGNKYFFYSPGLSCRTNEYNSVYVKSDDRHYRIMPQKKEFVDKIPSSLHWNFQKLGDSIVVFEDIYNDLIFIDQKNTIRVKKIIMPQNAIDKEILMDRALFNRNNKYGFFIQDIILSKNFYFITAVDNGKYNFCVFDVKKNSVASSNMMMRSNSLEADIPIWPTVSISSEKAFHVLSYNEIIGIRNRIKQHDSIPKALKFYDKNSNPVIQIFTFK